MTFVVSSHHMEDLVDLTERLLVLHSGARCDGSACDEAGRGLCPR